LSGAIASCFDDDDDDDDDENILACTVKRDILSRLSADILATIRRLR